MQHVETPFWQRQPRLPLLIQRYLRSRVEPALGNPSARQNLVWSAVLGSPLLREQYPEGIPQTTLLESAVKMLYAVGEKSPEQAFLLHINLFPDTAVQGATGWLPHEDWRAWSQLVSLRSGWQLSALTGLQDEDGYEFKAGIALFNQSLFYECHDALEPLWLESQGQEKNNLQLMILLAASFHHLQLHNDGGFLALSKDIEGRVMDQFLETSFGRVDIAHALEPFLMIQDLLKAPLEAKGWDIIWKAPRPLWDYLP